MMHLNNKTTNYIKLLVSGIIFIWLYVQSPFNPLYSEYSKSEINFVYIQFYYWLFLSSFFLWLIFFINKHNYEKNILRIILLSYSLNLAFYIFYGFDVLDTGFSLSKQWSMYHGLWKENFDAIAGTNLIGGLWLLIPGEPLLLWARLGFIAIQVSIVYFSYKIMLLYFKPKQLFLIFLVMSLFLAIWHFYQTINYDNLPYLFFIISIYILLKEFNSGKLQKYNYILSGSLVSIAIFCKISFAVAVILPIFMILTNQRIERKNKVKQTLLYYIIGLVIGLGIITGLILLLGGLNSYLFHFKEIINELIRVKDPTEINSHNHTFIRLYNKYKVEMFDIIANVFKFVFFIITIEYFRDKTKNIKSINYVVFAISFFILYYNIFETNEINQYSISSPNYILSFFLSIYILWAFFAENSIIKKYIQLIIAGLGLFFFSLIGSDLVLRAGFHIGSGLILFSTAVVLIKESEVTIFNRKFKYVFLFYFLIIAFSVNTINKRNNIYREPNFQFISKSFSTPSLIGIKSNPQRVDVVDSLITFLNQVPNLREKKILFTHSNVLMYYLLDVNYFMKSPWDILNNYYQLEKDFNFNKPDLFVVSKESHRIRTWPLKSEPDNAEELAKNYYEIYDRYIAENRYKIIYQNSFYTVYGLNL